MRAPVRRTNSISRCNISSSAMEGQPGTPMEEQHAPSCITAPSVRRATSQCCANVTPSGPAYSSARRIKRGSCTPFPSSVKMRTPSAAKEAYDTNCVPSRPTVMQPDGTTSQRPASIPRSRTNRIVCTLSWAGSVLGIATTAVNPPSAAARLPVSIVSASSLPGSRRWVCRSTNPDETKHPAASRTTSPGRFFPTSVMTPFSILTSASKTSVGFTTVAPRTTTDGELMTLLLASRLMWHRHPKW